MSLDEYVSATITLLRKQALDIIEQKPIQYGRQLVITDGKESVSVNLYSGKKGNSTVVAGSAKSALKKRLEEILLNKVVKPQQQAVNTSLLSEVSCDVPGFEAIPDFDGRWIGTDESGKGDFFGSLVIAGVYVNSDLSEKLISAGVKDSKALSDDKNRALASRIREVCQQSYVEIELTPARYNELYNQMKREGKNLNHLLAWGHARTIEDLLVLQPCRFALADQFANEKFIQSRLMAKGRQITLVQTHRAERNVAVAAASILARDRFLRRMELMEEKYGMRFPKGASPAVIKQAKAYVERFGKSSLGEVAKLHFKTCESI